ncbi:hypothetical protein [Pseudomonas koreensis]|uniref:hypothetical protein n=1 Tax=Pseudomonas koreensis TaxID=198620 RepID=UPI003824E8E5
MREPIIQANQSLVLNGDFTQALSQWVLGSVNPEWVAAEEEMYGGIMTRLLTASHGASVRQDIVVPKAADAKARYVLSFLFESRHAEAGVLSIGIPGAPDPLLEIDLPPGKGRDVEQDQQRLAQGLPLEFLPGEYEVELQLPLQRLDTIRVSVISPRNAPTDPVSKICITRIRLDLHLEPAVMQRGMLDEQTVSLHLPLPLCLGASGPAAHRLQFVPSADNAWTDTGASLNSDDNPQQAVLAIPDWGVDQQLDSPWLLECPVIGDQPPYLFTMTLLNQYVAAPYPVMVSLGHHRLMFREHLEPAYFPVLEYAQSVRVGVQVASYYTGQPLDEQTVTWTVEGQGIRQAVRTNTEGWAYFDFTPVLAGDFSIEASVDSLYYARGVETTTLQVRVLATDPWKEVLAVVEDVALPWAERTGYPNRGTDYPLQVRLPADSPLLGTELSLRWTGDSHEQLGVDVSPALEQPVPVEGQDLLWTLLSEDRLDGRFSLSLTCSRLLLPSPVKAMSLARNVVRIGDVQEANKFPVVDEGESVLLRVQVLHVVASGDGDAVRGALVQWVTPNGTIATVSGAGGWASARYKPTQAGDQVVTARIRAHVDAVAAERPFAVKALATSPWKNQISLLLDNAEVDLVELGVLCRRGRSHTLKVLPVAGSSLIGQAITLNWRGADPQIGLVVADIGVPKTLTAQGIEWVFSSVSASSLSGLFALQLSAAALSAPRELFGRLIAADLAHELTLMLDQVTPAADAQGFYPCLGARHSFKGLPNTLSPLVGLQARLAWAGTPADQLQATIDPPLNEAQWLEDGGVAWVLDFRASPLAGEFSLMLSVPALEAATSSTPMHLGHNKLRIAASHESAVDPVVGQDKAWQGVQLVSAFTEQPVEGAAVLWRDPHQSVAMPSDAQGWSWFAFEPGLPGGHTVVARALSLFDGYEEQAECAVIALANDPWDDVSIYFDGQSGEALGGRTYFPRRKGVHSFDLFVKQGSPLLGQKLTLGMTGTGPTELDVSFRGEGLGVPREFSSVGLRYVFTCGDLKDGSFALRLGAERLAQLSPANAMSLGEGAQVLKIIVPVHVQQTLEWGQMLEERVSVVSAVSGMPMPGWTVTWRHPDIGLMTSVTNFYGEASIRYTPLTPGATELTATVGEGAYVQSVALPYVLNEPRSIESLSSPKPSGNLGELVCAVVNVVSARTGEPLQNVEVMWEYPDRIIAPTRTDADGNARVEFMLSGTRKGLLQAIVTGGYAGWEMKTMVFTLMPNASTWLQEFTPYVNNVRSKWPDLMLELAEGGTCTLMLEYENSWLIGVPEAHLALQYVRGAEGHGVTFDPPLQKLVTMAEGTTSVSWALSVDQLSSQTMSLEFAMPLLEGMPNSPAIPARIVNIGQEVEVVFDKFPTVFGEGTAYPCLGAKHTVTVRPKPSSSLLGEPVRLLVDGEAIEKNGVRVTPRLQDARPLTEEGLTWELDCVQAVAGDFVLQLMLEGTVFKSPPLVMSLGHNLVTAERWNEVQPPHPGEPLPRTFHYIRAISSFLNIPAPGVRVSIRISGGTFHENTAGNGELVYSNDDFNGFAITNPYDGSIV